MVAERMSGKVVAEAVYADLRTRIEALSSAGIEPALAVVKVGDDPASAIYVRSKRRRCEELGIRSVAIDLPESTEQADLIGRIDALNADQSVHGILVQLPLPRGLDSDAVTDRIDPDKDVDGLHPLNAGRLATGRAGFLSCTPAGVMRMLSHFGVETQGKSALVIGRSNMVGKPMAAMLMAANATVTTAHSRTPNTAELARRADIVVAAAGQPELVRGDWIKPGAVVIDVGIHRRPEGGLMGDVKADEVAEVASWLSPVPGGVGPMTIAMLMNNAVLAAERCVGR